MESAEWRFRRDQVTAAGPMIILLLLSTPNVLHLNYKASFTTGLAVPVGSALGRVVVGSAPPPGGSQRATLIEIVP